jgi:hypothetical protein
MQLRTYALILGAVTLFSSACAQTKRTVVKSGASIARVIKATSERILPGRSESAPITNYRITLQWRSALKPTAFFWRPQEGWMQCLVVKSGGSEEEVAPEAIKKMQTVDIVPVSDADRTPIPAFVKATDKNKLYIQVGNAWYSIPVKLTKKQDVVTP